VWLLGCWTHALTDSLRPPIYNALVGVLHAPGPRSDALVKLSCARTLNGICEDWDFLPAAFRPLAAPAIQGLYALTSQVQELEALTLCLQTTAVIVARMGAELPPEAANAAISPLSAIWAGTGETHQILRKHVLEIITNVATVVNAGEVRSRTGERNPAPEPTPDTAARANLALPEPPSNFAARAKSGAARAPSNFAARAKPATTRARP
jgi:hypothetical protein